MSKNWVVVPTCLPIVLRRCHRCASGRFRPNGKFRVNANHKLLDAWLLALCTGCGDTAKVTVLERVNVRSVRPEVLRLLHGNAPGLAAALLQDPVMRRRDVGGSGRTGRPAWQSPYGPPSHRARRGRWAPVPGLAWPRSALRRGYRCDRCV
ncbi:MULTISPECIES: DUF1062 domain-containing protein [unclassified Streptomyces]|uniref:DUF1062 domain-containing protein n=1 Tax=unclassified Streptomyces TaxID=2593676 RepID=UPI002E80E4BC|nr:DUF1062 domain-containing protein [Streptomyces sp. NBC_00589]WTI38219.1 DUF1062 domain-containing protein [Streptomyces sp. NBC_00775]WUB28102.1 DUF1062 domain-containing protein [Streptomyces sp. NBC_00589]